MLRLNMLQIIHQARLAIEGANEQNTQYHFGRFDYTNLLPTLTIVVQGKNKCIRFSLNKQIFNTKRVHKDKARLITS